MRFLQRILSAKLSAPRPQPVAPDPPAGRFVWSAPRHGGEVGYALRHAIRARLGSVVGRGCGWNAFLVDVDLELDGEAWLRGTDVYEDPRSGDWTPFHVPPDARVHGVRCVADEATERRLDRGTGLDYLGFYPDQTEGVEGDLFRVRDGPFVGDLIYLGTGGRYGASSWAVGCTLVPGDAAQLDDPGLAEELVSLMHTVAVQNGAPGYRRPIQAGETAPTAASRIR